MEEKSPGEGAWQKASLRLSVYGLKSSLEQFAVELFEMSALAHLISPRTLATSGWSWASVSMGVKKYAVISTDTDPLRAHNPLSVSSAQK